ncbi:MAG: response regulator transcription factor [Candidatus Saccharimonadales bacterium]
MHRVRRILIVEDDLNLTLALYSSLSHTYKVSTAKTAASGIKKAQASVPDLIILDLNLPDLNGLGVTLKLREIGVQAPILVLSAEAGLISKVDLLDNGANDYVTKPFSLAELRSRIRVLLRDNHLPIRDTLVGGGLELNPNLFQVTVAGNIIRLRKKEYLLLECLMRNSGVTISRNYLRDYVWGSKHQVKDNSIDVHVKMLRDKVDRSRQHELIRTVQGTGYTFVAATKAKA